MNTLDPIKLRTMLDMQAKLNAVVNPNWATAKYPWYRAIVVEAVEALDHYGWKWWKGDPAFSLDQIHLELVDIWHFAMSMMLEQNEDMADDEMTEAVAEYFARLGKASDVFGEVTTLDTRQLFDLLIATAAGAQKFNGSAFVELMGRFELTWDLLYSMYIAKNVLNLFRQANGYKEGTYIKTWRGREDNVVLAELMTRHPQASPETLLGELALVYAAAQ